MRFLFAFLITSCTSLFYQPANHQFYTPEQFKLDYEEVHFKSSDGTKLYGWFLKPKGKPKGTVIQFHGNAENISSHFLALAWIVKEDYNLFVFDYRGYWKSEGVPTPEGVYLDSIAALNKAHELHKDSGAKKFIVFGQSLGGIVSLRAIPDFAHQEDIDLLVQDSTFSSYKRIAADRMRAFWLTWPFSPLAYVLISDEFASDKVFNKVSLPLLVITGGKDEVIPESFGKEIYKGVPARKKWYWHVESAPHISSFHVEEGKWRKEFLSLLEQLPQE